MNDFQGGVTANDLSPQVYKNSNQTPGIQSTLDSSDIQSGSLAQNVNTLPATGTLVVVGPSPATLGASTQTVSQPSSSNNFVPLALGVIIISAILVVYFFRNFKISFSPEDE